MAQGVLIPTTPRLVYSGCFDTRGAINFLATFGTITAADNGGKLQLQGAGAHGIDTTHGVGEKLILSGTGLPYGLYTILSRDSANNVTVDVASAGVSAVVAQLPAVITAPAATWTTLSVANNAGYAQVTSSGVHGLTAASVGRFITLTGTNWPGLCVIKSIDNTTNLTLDLAYNANLGTPVATVAGTATANFQPVITPAITLSSIGPCGSVEAEVVGTAATGAASKVMGLRPGAVVGSTTIPSGAVLTVANTVTEFRYKLGVYNITAKLAIAAAASTTPASSFGTSTSASVLAARSAATNTTGGLGVAVGAADEAIQILYARIVVYPTIR